MTEIEEKDPKKRERKNNKNYTVHDSELITARVNNVPVAFKLAIEVEGGDTVIGKLISIDRYALKMEVLEPENDEEGNDVWITTGQKVWIQKRYIVLDETLDGNTVKDG